MSLATRLRQFTDALRLRAAPAQTLPAAPEISVLIRHEYSCADGHTLIGVRTRMSTEDVHLAAVYLLHVRDELPVTGHDDGDLNETEVTELLCRFYPCTPFITHVSPGHDDEIELWRLWHSEWVTDLTTSPETLMRVARPGVRRAITELLLAGVRPYL